MTALFVAAGSIATAVVVVAFGSFSSPSATASPSAAALEPGASLLPRPVQPAFRPGKPVRLRDRATSQWAPVRKPALARSKPSPTAPAIAALDTRTPEETSNIVLVLGSARDGAGRLWVRVRLPVLPNNTTGWVRRSALGGYSFTTTRLVVELDRFRATLYRNGRRVFSADVGIGQPAWPTPTGQFYIRNKLSGFGNPFYGPVAFGTSARSDVLTDWPAGGFVGIHGTNQPELLPGSVSHGCIRMRNRDILRLADLMPVGTPLTIRR
jgi:L,D-transpeptidase catalytic domain